MRILALGARTNHLQVQQDLAARGGMVNVLAVTAGFVARAVHHEIDDSGGGAKPLFEVGAQGVAVAAAGRGPRIGLRWGPARRCTR